MKDYNPIDLDEQVREEVAKESEEYEDRPRALKEAIRLRNDFWGKHDGSNR